MLGKNTFEESDDDGNNKTDYHKTIGEGSTNKNTFKILVWRFENSARRKYVNGYTSKEKDVFESCRVRNCQYFYKDENILEADAILFYLHAVREAFKTRTWENMEKIPNLC